MILARKRGEGTWDEFLMQHAASLWQCDFFLEARSHLEGHSRGIRHRLSERQDSAKSS